MLNNNFNNVCKGNLSKHLRFMKHELSELSQSLKSGEDPISLCLCVMSNCSISPLHQTDPYETYQ